MSKEYIDQAKRAVMSKDYIPDAPVPHITGPTGPTSEWRIVDEPSDQLFNLVDEVAEVIWNGMFPNGKPFKEVDSSEYKLNTLAAARSVLLLIRGRLSQPTKGVVEVLADVREHLLDYGDVDLNSQSIAFIDGLRLGVMQ